MADVLCSRSIYIRCSVSCSAADVLRWYAKHRILHWYASDLSLSFSRFTLSGIAALAMLHTNKDIHHQSRDVGNELAADDKAKLLPRAVRVSIHHCFATHAFT